jgi:predicted DNA-binding transcriptional regulator AlpA
MHIASNNYNNSLHKKQVKMADNTTEDSQAFLLRKEEAILLTRKEAAELLGYKANTLAVWKSTKRYTLPCIKIGKSIRYRLSDIKALIKSNSQN